MGSTDATLVDFDGGSAFEDGMALDDYGYASDSDLEDEEEEEEKAGQTPASDETAVLEGDMSESDDDDDDDLLVVGDARSEIDSTVGDPIPTSLPQAATPITSAPIEHKRSVVNCRNVLVRDTAFRTWKALLLYCILTRLSFRQSSLRDSPELMLMPLTLAHYGPAHPKSMYRLACKVRLDGIRDQAFYAIRSGLDAGNILQELSSSLTSKYPAILQIQVEVLLQHISSVSVIQNIPSLLRRIADSQLPHGADIIIDLYQKILLRYHPLALALANAPPPLQSDGELEPRDMPSSPLPHPSVPEPVTTGLKITTSKGGKKKKKM